jgi:5'-3' exonuclease
MVNSEMRALVGIALSCDYYVGGIKGVGPHTAQELLLTLPSQTPNDLAAALANTQIQVSTTQVFIAVWPKAYSTRPPCVDICANHRGGTV